MERQTIAKNQTPVRAAHLQQQSAGPSNPAHPLLNLQSSIGNQALQRLINSQYIQAKLQVSTPGDPFEQEADRVADTVMRMPEPGGPAQIQPKSISTQITRLAQPTSDHSIEDEEMVSPKSMLQRVPVAVREDDEDEEKVAPKIDRMEEQPSDAPVLRRAADEESEEQIEEAPVQRQTEEDEEEEVQTKLSTVQRACTNCEEEAAHDEKPEAVQLKAAQPAAPNLGGSIAKNIHAMNGRGNPLPPATRAFFEPRFGADFSNVRIHTDSQAAQTAKAINARAFTVGPNIAFGASQFAPESQQGKQILAHELTHVVQQGAATGSQHIHRAPEMIQAFPQAGVIPPVTDKQRAYYKHADDVFDIQGQPTFKPSDGLGHYIASRWEAGDSDVAVNIKFGSLGSGFIFVKQTGSYTTASCLNIPVGLLGPTISICKDVAPESQNYKAEWQTIPLNHPAFESDKGCLVLFVNITNGFIFGKLAWMEGKKSDDVHPFAFQEAPTSSEEQAFLPLIYGTQYDGKNYTPGKFFNELNKGVISFISSGQVELANQQVVDGTLGVVNKLHFWLGKLKGKAKGLEEYTIPIERSAKAELFGETKQLVLDKEWQGGSPDSEDGVYTVQGQLRASYREGVFDFFGSASYKSKRIQGEVNIAIAPESEAQTLFAQHSPAEKTAKAAEPVPLDPADGTKEPLALTGWGNLKFKLIDKKTPPPSTGGAPAAGKKLLPEDLEGEGAFAVSPEGYIILSGKLKLPAQWPFSETHKYTSADPDADQKLFEKSTDVIRIPVPPWGSINLEFGISVDAEAQLNPLELYEIELTGVYSNHPDYRSEVGLTPRFYISGYAKATITVSAKAGPAIGGLITIGTVDGNLVGEPRLDAYIDAAPTISMIWPDKSGPASYAIAGKIHAGGKVTFALTGNISVSILKKELSKTEDYKIGSWTLGSFGLVLNMEEYVIGSGDKPKFDYSKIGFSAKERKKLAKAVATEKELKATPDKHEGGFTQLEDGKEVKKGELLDEPLTRRDLGAEAVDNVLEQDFLMKDRLHELSLKFSGTRDNPKALLEMASDKEPLDDKIEKEKLKIEVVKGFVDEDSEAQLEQRQKDIKAIDHEAETVTKNAEQSAQKLPEGEEPVVAGFDRLDDRIASYAKKHDVDDLGAIGPATQPALSKDSLAQLTLAQSTFKDEHWVRQQLQDLLKVSETTAKDRIRTWRQARKLFALETSATDPFKAYNFNETRAGERPLKDTESNRSKYGFRNPEHTSKEGQAILSKGWRSDSPPTSDPKSRYDSMRGGTRAKPPSPYVNFERPLARLGHGPVGASEFWNDGKPVPGHKQSYEENRKWNRDPANYWGPEHKDESDASGGSSPRYKVPLRAIGSHEDWL